MSAPRADTGSYPTGTEVPSSSWNMPATVDFNGDAKGDQQYSFGNFEDWMKWDDPLDTAFSSAQQGSPTTFEPKYEATTQAFGNDTFLSGGGVTDTIDTVVDPSDLSSTFIEDTTPFQDNTANDAFFQGEHSLVSTPITETSGLYSTPLSWERPQETVNVRANGQALSLEQEEQLRNIAMPNRANYHNSPNSVASSYKAASTSSPESIQQGNRKRKSSTDDDEEDADTASNAKHPPVKKTAHNMIEKRYRTNLNDKIAALRNSVPSLRAMSRNSKGDDDETEDLQGLTPAHKLNKATVSPPGPCN